MRLLLSKFADFFVPEILILTLLLSTVGCSHKPKNFTSSQPSKEDLPLTTTIKITGFQNRFEKNHGLAWHWKDPCEIKITLPKDPEDNYAFCTLGHEVWHCITGSFHHDQEPNCLNNREE